jgi:hypothetical protein
MTDILLDDSSVRVQGTLVCEDGDVNAWGALNVGKDPNHPNNHAWSVSQGGDVTAIGKLSVGGNVTTLASLFVGGSITAQMVQIGQMDVESEIAKLQIRVQALLQALRDANIPLPTSGNHGNFGGD